MRREIHPSPNSTRFEIGTLLSSRMRSVGKVLNSLIDVSIWSYNVEASLKELALYFNLPEN